MAQEGKRWPILLGLGVLLAVPLLIFMLPPKPPPEVEPEAEILAFTIIKG